MGLEKKNGNLTAPEEVEEEPFLKGRGASPGINKGRLKLIYDEADQASIEQDNIIVTLNPSKQFIPALNKIEGLIAEEGCLSSKFAFIARKFEIPVVVGAENATDILTPGEQMTINGSLGQIYEETEVQKEGPVQEVTASSQLNNGGEVTALDLKVASSSYNAQADGTLVQEELDRDQISQLANNYDPLPVWLNQSPQQQEEYDPWGPSESTDLTRIANNIGFLSNLDNLRQLKDCERRGVIIEDFASVMQLEDIVNRIDLAVIDVSSLAESSGKSYDHPALNNAIDKMVNICQDSCECSLYLKQADPRIIRKAVEQGIDSITVKPQELSKAQKLIAKEEKRFMMNKLRNL